MSESRGLAADQTYLGWPDGFWRGATFDVRTGAAAGVQGTLADSQRVGPDGFPRYTAQGPVPGLSPGDVVALTRTDDTGKPDRWMGGDQVVPVVGGRAARQSRSPIGDARGRRDEADGHGDVPRFDRRPRANWQATMIDFDATDSGPPGTLEVHFWATGTGRVFLDDVELAANDDTPGAFRAAVLETLRALQPGHLRDWQGGQGFTLENRLVAGFGRRTTRCSPRADATLFEYGLPEFFDLCRAVGAGRGRCGDGGRPARRDRRSGTARCVTVKEPRPHPSGVGSSRHCRC